MVKYFFILGRNPKLSRAEILSFLEARSRKHKEIMFEENILIIETDDDERLDIQEFGGTLKLGKILFEGGRKDLEEYIKKNEIVPADKFSYGVFGNIDPEILKEKFKSERKKAILKHGRTRLAFQDGEKVELPNAEFSLLLHESKGIIYLGNATQEYNYEEIKKRDMGKPIRRESLAISPRLSKILINLSGAKPYDLILDPFCGIGSILQEALVKKMNVYGIDYDREAISGAEKNIEWLKKNYKIETKYTLENLDSKKTPDLQFNAIATETPLGKLLKKRPNDNVAKQLIQNFEALIIPILKRLKKSKKPSAKIAITFPVIGRFRVDAQKIANKTELKIILQPIEESRPDQFISRDIVVLK